MVRKGQLWCHPFAREVPSHDLARALLTQLQHCEIVQNLQVMNREITVLHILPELCKVQQHSRW